MDFKLNEVNAHVSQCETSLVKCIYCQQYIQDLTSAPSSNTQNVCSSFFSHTNKI